MDRERILHELEFLRWKFAGATVGAWLGFLIISAAVFVLLRWAQRVAVRRLQKFASGTATTLDDLIVELIRHTNGLFLLVVSLFIGSLELTLRPRTLALAHAALMVALFCQMGLWAGQVINYGIEELVRRRDGEDTGLRTAAGALGFIGRVAVWSAIMLLVLSNLHVNITTLIAGLGVGGIAVALAVQNVLGDLFASLSILFDKPFAVGHFIVVDDLSGTVEHVGLKTTRLRSLSGEEIVVSNTDLLKSRIHNYRRLYERRVLFSFGVTYDTGHNKLAAIPAMVREIVEHSPKTRFDRAHFKEYGDSSLNYEVVYYVLDSNYNTYMDIQQTINLELYKRFEQAKIEFAFPTRTLYISGANAAQAARAEDAPEITDGSRES
jgi:small-conductance mechanosensitive channel